MQVESVSHRGRLLRGLLCHVRGHHYWLQAQELRGGRQAYAAWRCLGCNRRIQTWRPA